MSPETHNRIIHLADEIGELLEKEFPTHLTTHGQYPAIPSKHVDEITDYITLIVANILQAWLNAGSERDVTIEALTEPIREHVRGWCEAEK